MRLTKIYPMLLKKTCMSRLENKRYFEALHLWVLGGVIFVSYLFYLQHAEDVKRVLSKDKLSRLKELRDQQLEERIQEHAKHIREWRQKNRLDKMETDLEVAKQNLEKVY